MATCFKIKNGFIFALLCFCFKGSDTQCSSSNHFGPNCDIECHCMNNEQCNSSTGNCPSGCDFDWVGPGCQSHNILPAGQKNERVMVTRHRSNIPQIRFASLAVDRDLSTCSHTNYANVSQHIPWWRLWLKDKYKIRNISIVTTKESLDYFKNFEVMVENETFIGRYGNSFTGQELCYKHDDSSPRTKNIDVTCNKPIFGNQLRIRLATSGTQLVLCDVRIYGECSDGTFGVNCTETCSTHCEDVCNKDYGTCSSCSPGWTGTSCNQVAVCDNGKYGESCKFSCSGNCKNNASCRTTDGFCTDGCSPGYKGGTCKQICSDGKYGANCVNDCSAFCINGTACRKTDGICVGGCKPGYRGRKCDLKCTDGLYGRGCAFSCSGNCRNNSMCSNVDGSCDQGCKAGYKGNRCNEKCQDGFYGANCTRNCSTHCLNGTLCLHTNGTCANGCDPGWTGDTCEDECRLGTYGAECTSTCSTHCLNGAICLHTNGSCTNGCEPGWSGDTCMDECRNGTYGEECASTCSTHCLNGAVCLYTNGSCTNGCEPGWTGDTCMDVCVDGYYGHECIQKCSTNCVGGNLNCDNVFGSCMSGCRAGWIGRKCDEVCPTGRWGINCANSCGLCTSGNCRHTDGVCDGDCAAGVKNTPHCDEECNDGNFGINCSGVCSNNCKDVCRKQTGECKHCKSGWHGATCTLECEDGRWGENCKRTCLTCRNETCNRISGACNSQCKPGFKQTEYCDQECSNGWYGLNCSEECNSNCKDVTFCKKTDGSCIECKPGLEGKICNKAVKQTEKRMHISGGGIAAVAVTVIVLIFFSVFVSVFITRKRLHINHNKFENETVSYSNVLAAETSSTVLKTPESNLNVEMENVYDIIKRTSGIEHTYE